MPRLLLRCRVRGPTHDMDVGEGAVVDLRCPGYLTTTCPRFADELSTALPSPSTIAEVPPVCSPADLASACHRTHSTQIRSRLLTTPTRRSKINNAAESAIRPLRPIPGKHPTPHKNACANPFSSCLDPGLIASPQIHGMLGVEFIPLPTALIQTARRLCDLAPIFHGLEELDRHA